MSEWGAALANMVMMKNPLEQDLNSILDRTRDLWEELRGERIFITGGTGFFGCWLLESFLWANEKLNLGAQAVVLSRDPEAFKTKAPKLTSNSSVHLLQGDIRTFTFPDDHCAFIIHGATESASEMNEKDPAGMIGVAVNGTKRILEFATAYSSEKLLLLSSGAVYGKQPPDLSHLSEEYVSGPDSTLPSSAYAEGKRVMELLCSICSRDTELQVKVARGFAFVGPYFPLNSHFAIGNFIKNALKGESIVIRGSGDPFRSYMYATDLAVWLWTILFKGADSRVYNVGSDQAVTILELAHIVAEFSSPQPEVNVLNELVDEPMNRYVPSILRAMEELNLTREVELPHAIQSTLEWYRSQFVPEGIECLI